MLHTPHPRGRVKGRAVVVGCMSFLGLFSLRVYEEKPKDAADGVGSVHNSIVVSLFSLAL